MTELVTPAVSKDENHPSPFISFYPASGWVFIPELDFYIFPTHVEVVEQVRAEIADPQFKTRTHGLRGTFFKGCSGPLCRKAQRDWARVTRRRKAERLGTPIVSRLRFTFLDEIDPLLIELYHLQMIKT